MWEAVEALVVMVVMVAVVARTLFGAKPCCGVGCVSSGARLRETPITSPVRLWWWSFSPWMTIIKDKRGGGIAFGAFARECTG